jgi:hypothetical protein
MPIDASPSGTLDIENATLRSRGIVALTNMVAGNDVVRPGGPALEVYGDPGPRLELVSNTAATDGTATFTRLESNVGVFSIQSGTDGSTNGPITFGGFNNERMRIAADGNVGIGTNSPGATLDIRGSVSNPSISTVHIGDNAADLNGDYGMVNLVRHPTDGGTKAHLAFIRNGNSVFGQGYYNNTNTFGFWPSFGSVANTPAMSITSAGYVGIGTATPLSSARLDVRGDGMIFDKAEGDGTILSGLYNYTETQQAIDAGVQGGAGTITASTDIDPPPGTAGDVIGKFVNTVGGEAVTNTWYPGVIPVSVGTVIYFGVWIYATQNIDMEFFRFHDTGAQNVAFSYTTPNKWVWFEKTITSNRAWNTSTFRFDNNSTGRTVYLTGLTIRVGQSQNTKSRREGSCH